MRSTGASGLLPSSWFVSSRITALDYGPRVTVPSGEVGQLPGTPNTGRHLAGHFKHEHLLASPAGTRPSRHSSYSYIPVMGVWFYHESAHRPQQPAASRLPAGRRYHQGPHPVRLLLPRPGTVIDGQHGQGVRH